jgi:O-antigen chain-terminating bifunctional methyltransferase/kinase
MMKTPSKAQRWLQDLRLFMRFMSLKPSDLPTVFKSIRQLFKINIFYQPLYGHILARQNPQRYCLNRADAIYHFLSAMGPTMVLDVGCNFGFFSYYLAERAYYVHGIDSDRHCIDICKLLSYFNPRNTPAFNVAQFDLNYITQQIRPEMYDVALLLSTLHHITSQRGVPYVQRMMHALLEKIPILIVELAVDEEEVPYDWKKGLPLNALDIFSTCPDVKMIKLGHFTTHLSNRKRPLYAVMKNSITVNERRYEIEKYSFVAYDGIFYKFRTFYDAGPVFIKNYRLNLPMIAEDNKKQILNEITIYQALPDNNSFPKLVDYVDEGHSIKVVLTKLPGTLLQTCLEKEMFPLNAVQIVHGILKAVRILLESGYYHNDIRPWNIMLDGDDVYLFDLGKADTKEHEDTITGMLWIIYQLHTGCSIDYIHNTMSYPLVTRPEIPLEELEPALRQITEKLLQAPSITAMRHPS